LNGATTQKGIKLRGRINLKIQMIIPLILSDIKVAFYVGLFLICKVSESNRKWMKVNRLIKILEKITDLVGNLSYINKTTYTFLALFL
jgi:hypothetical protein